MEPVELPGDVRLGEQPVHRFLPLMRTDTVLHDLSPCPLAADLAAIIPGDYDHRGTRRHVGIEVGPARCRIVEG